VNGGDDSAEAHSNSRGKTFPRECPEGKGKWLMQSRGDHIEIWGEAMGLTCQREEMEKSAPGEGQSGGNVVYVRKKLECATNITEGESEGKWGVDGRDPDIRRENAKGSALQSKGLCAFFGGKKKRYGGFKKILQTGFKQTGYKKRGIGVPCYLRKTPYGRGCGIEEKGGGNPGSSESHKKG